MTSFRSALVTYVEGLQAIKLRTISPAVNTLVVVIAIENMDLLLVVLFIVNSAFFYL